jgi:hypothetical protein
MLKDGDFYGYTRKLEEIDKVAKDVDFLEGVFKNLLDCKFPGITE